MPKSFIYILVLAVILLAGCEKDEPGDPNYPVKIEEVSEEVINNIVTRLAQTPLFNCTSIDTFGFCFVTSYLEDCEVNDSVHISVDLTEDEVKSIFSIAVTEYSDLLHLEDPSLVIPKNISTLDGYSFENFKLFYPDSTPENILVSSDIQYYNNLPVLGTTIRAVIHRGVVVSIGGRRFNNIYMPSTDVFSADSAMVSLYNQTFTYNNTKIKPTEDTYWSDPRKIILPVLRNDKIELLVCWDLYPGSWEIIVDSQTGEVLSSINIDKI